MKPPRQDEQSAAEVLLKAHIQRQIHVGHAVQKLGLHNLLVLLGVNKKALRRAEWSTHRSHDEHQRAVRAKLLLGLDAFCMFERSHGRLSSGSVQIAMRESKFETDVARHLGDPGGDYASHTWFKYPCCFRIRRCQ